MKLKYFLSSVTGLAMMIVFSGCLKSTPVEPPKPVSFVSVVNMSFKAPAVELLFGSDKVTPPMNPGVFFTRYSAIDPGILNVTFKKASADSLVAALPAAQSYDSSKYYTLLLFDQPSGGSGAVRIQDVFPSPDATRVFLRFFHMSVGQPNVDLEIENTKVFMNRSAADNVATSTYNTFQPYTPGSYALKAKIAGTDSVVASTTFSDLIAGGIYTIFLKGDSTKTGSSALGIEVLRASN